MFIYIRLLNAIFLPSFLRVQLMQDSDHLLARKTCFGSTLEMQCFSASEQWESVCK